MRDFDAQNEKEVEFAWQKNSLKRSLKDFLIS